MELDPKTLALFTEGYTKILEGIGALGFDVADANFADTAARAAKGLHELIHDQKQVKGEVAEKALTPDSDARHDLERSS